MLCDATQTPRLVLTLHNMDNSGECSQEEFCYSGAPFHMQKYKHVQSAPSHVARTSHDDLTHGCTHFMEPQKTRPLMSCHCPVHAGLPGEMFAAVDKALDERTIGHNPERLNLLKGGIIYSNKVPSASARMDCSTLPLQGAICIGD